ncbi:MAG: hypothetical protein ACKVX7_15990 [Planctomycetota bacterium]
MRHSHSSAAALALLVSALALTVPAQAQPGALVYEGSTHSPLGAATLTLDPAQRLIVSNIGSSGEDGVSIQLASFRGWTTATDVDVDAMFVGASMSAAATGSDGSGALITLAEATVTRVTSEEFVFSGDGGGGGAAGDTMRVYFGGQLVHEEPGTSFSFAVGLSGFLHWRTQRAGDVTSLRMSVDCGVIRHRFGATVIIGDAVEYSRPKPCAGLPEDCDNISSLRLVAGGLGAFTLGEEAVRALGTGFSASGAAALSSSVSPLGTPVMRCDNLGSSGQDGVSVRFPTLMSECFADFTPPVPGPVPGASLTIGSRGIVAGSDTFLGSLALVDVGGSLTCTPDYSPISATSLLIEVYNAGMPVVSIPGVVMPSIQIAGSEFPRGCGKLDQWPLLCLWSEWQTARVMTINGTVVVLGDELRVIAEGSVEVVAISELQLSTSGISSLEFTGAGGTSFEFPHRPPPMDIDIDLLTGNAILNWQASIAYRDISVTVVDDDTQSAVVYPVPGTSTQVDLGSLTTNGRIVSKFCLGQDTTVNPAEVFVLGNRLYGGLNHFALGAAQLSTDSNGLVVSNIGSSGEDGVRIELSNFAGVGIQTICELPGMPVGASVSFNVFRPSVGEWRVAVTRDLDGARFTPSDDTGTPVTYTLRAGLGDLTTYEATGVSGDVAIGFLPPGLQNLRYSPDWSGPNFVHVFHIEDGYVSSGIDPNPDNLCVFNRFEFEVESALPISGPALQLDIRGQGVPMLMLGEEKQTPARLIAVPTGGTTPRPRQGNARVVGTLPTVGTAELHIENLGSSGQDVVSFDFGSLVSECSLTFAPISPPVGIPCATLTVGATGAVFGQSQFLGDVSIENTGSSLSLTPDYSPIAATSHQIDVYDQGALVASFPGLVSPVIEVQDIVFPYRCGKLNQWPLLCLWFEWQNQRVITVNGAVLLGDEIRVIAGGSVEVNAIGSLDLSTLVIPELTITATTSTPYVIPTITGLSATQTPDGHVIVSWTNPVVYGGGVVVVGDTLIPLASPAPEQVDIGVPSPDLIYIWIKLVFEKYCIVIEIDIPFLLSMSGGPQFQRGDANGDAQLNIGDPIFLLSYLFSGGAASGCFASGDANDDGTVNIGDPIFLLSYSFSGGAPPSPPFPGCGTDPTGPPLACTSPNCP